MFCPILQEFLICWGYNEFIRDRRQREVGGKRELLKGCVWASLSSSESGQFLRGRLRCGHACHACNFGFQSMCLVRSTVVHDRRPGSRGRGSGDVHRDVRIGLPSGILRVGIQDVLDQRLSIPRSPSRSPPLGSSYPHLTNTHGCRLQTENILRKYQEYLDQIVSLKLKL